MIAIFFAAVNVPLILTDDAFPPLQSVFSCLWWVLLLPEACLICLVFPIPLLHTTSLVSCYLSYRVCVSVYAHLHTVLFNYTFHVFSLNCSFPFMQMNQLRLPARLWVRPRSSLTARLLLMWHVYLCLCACLSAFLHFARVTEDFCGLWSSVELKRKQWVNNS